MDVFHDTAYLVAPRRMRIEQHLRPCSKADAYKGLSRLPCTVSQQDIGMNKLKHLAKLLEAFRHELY